MAPFTKAGKVRSQSQPIEWRYDKKTGAKVLSKTRTPKKGGALKGGSPKHGKRSLISRIRRRGQYRLATTCPACRSRIDIGALKCWKCKTRLEWIGAKPKAKERRTMEI